MPISDTTACSWSAKFLKFLKFDWTLVENEHANSLFHVLSELSKLKAKTEQLNDEVSDLNQRLQDDSFDESNSENED